MKILIIRLSAMGDVAMTTPVIKAMTDQNKDLQITLITNKLFNPFFSNINNLKIVNPDLKDSHKGVTGLFKLFKTLKKEIDPDIIIDLHNVIRTKILRFFFVFTKVKSFKISKGRKDKKLLTRRKNKKLKELKHTVLRYSETINKAGIKIDLKKAGSVMNFKASEKVSQIIDNKTIKIGFAPFAKHQQKQYPLKKTKEVIHSLAEKNYNIFIFGGGKDEQIFAEELETSSSKIISMIGKISLKEEISLIDNMDVMITMDSANMHMAALTNTHIISIWGATHPYAGFTPYKNDDKSVIIQNNKINCRPCSVYGNKTCYKNTLECLESIAPKEIISACDDILKSKQL